MVVFVILCNILLTLLNLYLVLQLGRLRRTLVRVTRTLTYVEGRIHRIFYPAPEIVMKGQQGTAYLRLRYEHLQIQLEGLEKLVIVVNLALKIWRRQGKSRRIKIR